MAVSPPINDARFPAEAMKSQHDQWVLQSIMDGLSALQAEVKSITLICDRETLSNAGRMTTVANGERINGLKSVWLR